MLVAMSGLNEAYLATTDGRVLDTLHVPAVRRRGVPDDIQQRMDDWGSRSSGFELSSAIRGFHRDTLFLLDRRLNASEDGLETLVRAYRIDTAGCTWLPVG